MRKLCHEFKSTVELSEVTMNKQINNFILFYLILLLGQTHVVSSFDLCIPTDEIIEHYGYQSEVHHVTTEDGYILTMFRCNSRENSSHKKKPLIAYHGILGSSDDFCVNPPNQGLAYVFADAGYDVWIPNSRGNFYSRDHLFKDPNITSSGFWNFSWYEIGVYDQPAIVDYILEETCESKVFFIGHSEGATCIMTCLIEKPEYNEKIQVASLMSPVGYMNHITLFYKISAFLYPISEPTIGYEFLPKDGMLMTIKNFVCHNFPQFCNGLLNLLYGPSDQRNIADFENIICRIPSGASAKQLVHYGQEIHFHYFGKYKNGPEIPKDFPLSKITVPITIHYSTSDYICYFLDINSYVLLNRNDLDR